MWSSKLEHIHNDAGQAKPGTHISRDGNAPSRLAYSVSTAEDGIVELDLGTYSQAERTASVPVQYRGPPLPKNNSFHSDDNVEKHDIHEYINQQGRKVKLAHLAPSPSPYSIFVTAKKNQARNEGRPRLKTKSLLDVGSSHTSGKKIQMLKRNSLSDANVTKRSTSNSVNYESSSASGFYNGSEFQGSMSVLGDSGQLQTKNSKVLENEPNIEFRNKQNRRECSDFSSDKVSNLKTNDTMDRNHPSVVKKELNQGLEKIMADLAALDVPLLPSNSFVGERDSLHVETLTSDNLKSVEDDDGKENDSPLPPHTDIVNFLNRMSPESEDVKKPLTTNTSSKLSSYDATSVFKKNQFYSKRSSTSSLNSAHKTCSVDSNEAKPCKALKRQRGYDPVKAREYIRQQKQERLNRLKAEREHQRAEMQARKEKLDELSRTSSKLVKASIKRKPNIIQEDKVLEPEDENSYMKLATAGGNELPKQIGGFDLIDNCSSLKRNIPQSAINDYSLSNIPTSLSHDDSSARLIKDICEMKTQIEALTKTLRTTITAKRTNVSQPKSSVEERTNVLGPTCESRKDTGFAHENVDDETDGCNDQTRTPSLRNQQLHLQNLSSNLKKFRESFHGVLNQNEVQLSTSSVKSEMAFNSNHQKHRRFSSAGSDSAFEAMKFERGIEKGTSLDGKMTNTMQKKKITTSFPTLPVVETQNVIFNRSKHVVASQEPNLNLVLESSNPVVEKSKSVQTKQIREQNSNNADKIISCNKEEQSPKWLEPISKPYPINFISAVKRKLGSSPKAGDTEGTTAGVSEPNSVPTVTQDMDSFHRFSKYPPVDIKADLPPFVTARSTLCSNYKPMAWSKAQSTNVTSSTTTPTLTQATICQESKTNETKAARNTTSLSTKSSIVDALNLEEMQAEFARALNPLAVKSYNVTPAEKPLSAPNTPAKTSLKLIRPIALGKTGKLNFDLNMEGTTACNANSELVPPNVSLATFGLERKSRSVDSWVSHSRGAQIASANKEEQSLTTTRESSSSKDTFEIGQVFNPTALHLQFQAELNILDSFNESLCQVMEVEKVRAVALARQQTLSHLMPMPVEDKGTDVQTSLLKSSSEISSINYQRGSKHPSDVTLLDVEMSEIIPKLGATENSAFLSHKENCVTPSATIASDTLVSSHIEKVDESSPISSNADVKSDTQVDSLISKSVCEDLYTMSDSIPEEIIPKLDKNVISEDVHSPEEVQMLPNHVTSNGFVPKDNGTINTLDQSLSLNFSADSVKDDSTFAGDALIVESLHSNDKRVFPSLVPGEDMFQFNLQMLEQLMHEEELRVQHRNTLFKLRVKVLGEMARTGVAALDLDKKKIRERGDEGHKDQMTALRKKQRGIMLRFQQQREEIERIRRTEELAWEERRLMYLQQMHLIRMQISTHVMLQKFEKCGNHVSKKSRLCVKSIQDSKSHKFTMKNFGPEVNRPLEVPKGQAVPQSSSVSGASLVSEGSNSSVMSNSSHRGTSNAPGSLSAGDNVLGCGGAGDSESSHLEERVLKGLHELESRSRNFKDREKVLHERRQSVEQIIQWRRMLEEEERRLRDVERQAHSRHRSTIAKHVLRDRSTSPFQFPENGTQGTNYVTGSLPSGRNVPEMPRNLRNNAISIPASASGSASITEDIDSSIPEESGEQNSKPCGESTVENTNVDQYANESFESEVSEVKTQESFTTLADGPQASDCKALLAQSPLKPDSSNEAKLPKMSERSNKYPCVTIKVPLSPRLQRVQRRRYSSGSDDSMVLSQTETGSEQSDIEGRISALSEQLHQCKAEADRLRREAKRTRNERLVAKEQSLHKQLQAYESYICQLRHNLEAELRQSSVPIVRPQIKQPRVSPGKVASRRQDADAATTPGSDRSVSQAASPEAASTSLHREEIETESKEVETASEAISTAVSEGASEIPSEVPSEVPSDVASEAASEVSENSSLVSQDAPSLVAIRGAEENTNTEIKSAFVGQEKTEEAFCNQARPGSSILSRAEEHVDIKNAKVELVSGDVKEQADILVVTAPCLNLPEISTNTTKLIEFLPSSKEETTCSNQVELPVNDFNESVINIQENLANLGSCDNNDDNTASTDQVKSLSSDEEIDDISETIDDDQGALLESSLETNVIQVFVREREKEIHVSPLLSVTDKDLSVSASKAESSREGLVDAITNDLLNGLLKECLRSAIPFHTPSKEAYWNKIVDTSLQEATIDVLSIYEQRLAKASNQQKDVRKRVNEILSETQASCKLRAEGRIKEIMTTAYGVLSPDDSPCGSPSFSSSPLQQPPAIMNNEDSDTTYNKMAEASAMKSNAGKASDAQVGLIGENVMDCDGFSQEWFDEDFGLTRSRRVAEELRLKQLEIEQEIEQLQQQQAQVQEQIPYYYVREIPNKPPPPYTPPGQAPRVLSSSTSAVSFVEEVRSVCTDRSVILKAIVDAVDLLYEGRCQSLELQNQEAPSTFLDAGFGLPPPSHLTAQEAFVHKNNARVYRLFLFDLAKELVMNAYSSEAEDPSPPWLRPDNWLCRRKALTVVPKSKEMLHDMVSRQVLVLFGFVPKASKENLTIRWSRKKRDHVDELLVRESQEEERQWTNYEQDEAVVKNNVAMAILDSLLDDTVQVLRDVFRRREQRHLPLY